MKRVSKAVVMIAVALSVGLHWVVLQSVAWTGMFVEYSAEYPLVTAIEKTFDGGNKCKICRLVEDETQTAAETEADYTVKLTKIDGFNGDDGARVFAPPVMVFTVVAVSFPPGRSDCPPVLPPPQV